MTTNKTSKGCPLADGNFNKMAAREPTCTGDGIIEVGCHSSFSPPSPAPEGSQVPIYCWMNGADFLKNTGPDQ